MSPLENWLPCPLNSKYYISLRKAYTDFNNSNATTNNENSILDKYCQCAVKYHIAHRHNLYISAFEDVLLNCCNETEGFECRDTWAPNVISCLLQKGNYIDGTMDERLRKIEIDQNYELTTKLKKSLKKEKKKFLKFRGKDDEAETKWISCPKDSKYFKSLSKMLENYLNLKYYDFNNDLITSNLSVFTLCFVEYIVEIGPDINTEMEHALYKCCDGIESSECKEDWAVNILSCWIEHKYFYLGRSYKDTVSDFKIIEKESSKREKSKLNFKEKKGSRKIFNLRKYIKEYQKHE